MDEHYPVRFDEDVVRKFYELMSKQYQVFANSPITLSSDHVGKHSLMFGGDMKKQVYFVSMVIMTTKKEEFQKFTDELAAYAKTGELGKNVRIEKWGED